MYSNINHLLSKFETLQSIIEETSPTVIALVETKLGEKQEIAVDGYYPVPMNRDENGGGVMILVKKELKNITVTVEKKKDVGEVLWVTLSNGRNNIRMGVVYAPQENKTKLDELQVMYKGLKEQIKQARKEKQNILLVGDFNCKIGPRIKGNTDEITKGGKLLVDMAQKLHLDSE